MRRFPRHSQLLREIGWAADVRGKRAVDWLRRCFDAKVTTLDGTAMLLLSVAAAGVILSAYSAVAAGHPTQSSQSAAAREGPREGSTALPSEPTR